MKPRRQSIIVETWMEPVYHGDLLLGKFGHWRTDVVLEEIRIGVDRVMSKKIRKGSGEQLTLVGGRSIVESREHLGQPDRRPKKLIAGEAWEMWQEFIRRGNPVDTCGRSCGSLSVGRT